MLMDPQSECVYVYMCRIFISSFIHYKDLCSTSSRLLLVPIPWQHSRNNSCIRLELHQNGPEEQALRQWEPLPNRGPCPTAVGVKHGLVKAYYVAYACIYECCRMQRLLRFSNILDFLVSHISSGRLPQLRPLSEYVLSIYRSYTRSQILA